MGEARLARLEAHTFNAGMVMAHEQDAKRHNPWAVHTQVATQLMEERTPAQVLRDLGRQVSPTLRELFVVCDPSEALRQHFELGVTPFVLLHDLGDGAAHAFLQGVSAQSGWRVQTLSIRRQGFGTVLASLSYLDCPLAAGSLRIYLSEVQADDAREQAALGRLLVGAASVHVLIGAVQPPPDVADRVSQWRDAMLSVHHAGSVAMLALPQGRDPEWMMSLSTLARTPRWQVELAPATHAAAANWTLLATYWNRQAQAGVPGALPMIDRLVLSSEPAAPAAPRPPKPMPPIRGASEQAPVLDLAAHLAGVVAQTGALHACVFSLANQEVWAQSEGASGKEMATQGHALLAHLMRMGQHLSLGRSVREAHVSLGEAQVLLRATRLRSGGVLMLVLPRDADTSRVRERLQQYEAQALPTRAVP